MPGSFNDDFNSDFDNGVLAVQIVPPSPDDPETLSAGPHVARCWFLDIDLVSGPAKFHNGVGRISIDGVEWRGVTDPVGGQVVGIEQVESPRFGSAAAMTITIASPTVEFFRSVKEAARAIEGKRADLYWAAFDPETEQLRLGLKKLFPGKASSPVLYRNGSGQRTISLTIECKWQGQNFPFGGKWNDADQQRRYPGDKGFMFAGTKMTELWS